MTRLQPPSTSKVPPAMVKTDFKSTNTTPTNSSHNHHGVGKLHAALMVILIIFLSLTLYINVTSTSSAVMAMHHYSAAVNQAMEDFKYGGALTTTVTRKEEKTLKETVEVPPGGLSQQQQKQPMSKIATLSCEPYGGPPDEFAQEMIYWQNVPSDELYVSPFKQKKGEQRRYMTFEPDGGENRI
jgi:hypothetical protein